jgi:HEAT repeat protein
LERAQQRLQRLREAHNTGGVAEKEALKVHAAGAGRDVRPTMARRERSAGGANPTAAADEEEPEDDPDNIPALTNTALHDADPDRRVTAVNLLSASEDVSVIPVLAEVLKEDSDPDVRMAALQSLSDFTDDAPAQVVDAAEIGLNDSDPEYRLEALGILADIGDERARAVMEKALNDPDEEVRSMAEGILDSDQLYEPTPAEQAPTAAGQVPRR